MSIKLKNGDTLSLRVVAGDICSTPVAIINFARLCLIAGRERLVNNGLRLA